MLTCTPLPTQARLSRHQNRQKTAQSLNLRSLADALSTEGGLPNESGINDPCGETADATPRNRLPTASTESKEEGSKNEKRSERGETSVEMSFAAHTRQLAQEMATVLAAESVNYPIALIRVQA